MEVLSAKMDLIDTHAHLDFYVRKDTLEIVRNNYLEMGINRVINNGYNYLNSKLASEISNKYPEVFYTVGIHPENQFEYTSTSIEDLKGLVGNKCLAIGEIGLDYHYEGYDRLHQIKILEEQVELARELNLPVVFHSRDACQDTVNFLKNCGYADRILLHCFSESIEIGKICSNLGCYFSFGGALTFKNSKRIEVLKSLPMDRIFFETDSPYMSPVPVRGTENHPGNVKYVYEYVANSLNIDMIKLSEKIKDNTQNFFGNKLWN